MQKKKLLTKKKKQLCEISHFFSCLLLNKDFACVQYIQGNQLLPDILLKLSDTLHKQYRYIGHTSG